MAKIVRTETQVDEGSGEILSRTSNVIELKTLPKEPDYIKLYVEDIGRLHGLKPQTREVLLYVAAASGYDGIATISARRKAMIAHTIGTTTNVVSNSLTECVKAGLLRRVAQGEYEPNPNIFARGSWAEIRERRASFVASFVYGPNGRQSLDSRPLTAEEADRLDPDNLNHAK
jgi:hypothetical protein